MFTVTLQTSPHRDNYLIGIEVYSVPDGELMITRLTDLEGPSTSTWMVHPDSDLVHAFADQIGTPNCKYSNDIALETETCGVLDIPFELQTRMHCVCTRYRFMPRTRNDDAFVFLPILKYFLAHALQHQILANGCCKD